MPAVAAMDVPLETTSPRRKDKIAEALHNMGSLNHNLDRLDLPSDPDAQATVTDLLDFTDYLPSDLMRSLTLLGHLDQTFINYTKSIEEHTKTYGALADIPAEKAQDALKFRTNILQDVNGAAAARNFADAEACRAAENVDRHLARARNIHDKLVAIREAYPTSRDASPEPQKSRSPQVSRAQKPKITLRLDGSRKSGDRAGSKVRHRRMTRITVPGEVLAPYDLDYESYGSESDESIDEAPTPGATPGRSLGGTIKLKLNNNANNNTTTTTNNNNSNNNNAAKNRTPKPARPPRAPGMGTNVHSAVAGISTSNALAKLKPPPEDAVLGGPDAPWLQLTAWELAKLRKRMKKNAVWSPSDTMISRELKTLGRGIEAYRAAKSKADAVGEALEHSIQPLVDGDDGTRVSTEGAISLDTLEKAEVQLSNRGMKLNEAKKLKRENQAKELAKVAAEEAEDASRKMAVAAEGLKDLFGKTKAGEDKSTPAPAKTPKRAAPKKRKRETEEPVVEKVEVETPQPVKPAVKKAKMETPIPPPPSLASTIVPVIEPAPFIASTSDAAASRAESAPAPVPTSPKKSSTPILPPGTVKREVKKEIKKAQPVKAQPPPSAVTPPPLELLPAKRPTSARAALSRPTSRGKAASVEPVPTATKDRPRRASTVHNTPAPEARAPPNRRAKRPAPGIVTGGAGIEGAKAVSKRSAAPRKKGGKKQKDEKSGMITEVMDEIDDEGNVIDPNEPRYCVCNRVSFGTMIGCENDQCEKEWFHLECVGLTEIPARTTKWYCPDCRVNFDAGERGEIDSRGKKK
ncbi:PHD-finger domain-containing protein [Phlyctema vagabunda]|uniref:PHD-finger domain-containing protein n=1 Tax=Phlyctema vagabunda TaxID=108571 RepID=A0ABR4PJZ7_9HELO